MQTQEALKNRRSCRIFKSKSIPKKLVTQIIEAARLAPSAINIQPWEFVVITNKETLGVVASLADHGKFISNATACIAVFCKDSKYYLEDGCAATENILIAAQDLGLGSCWVAGDKKDYNDKIRQLLGAPIDMKLVSLIPLGYTDTPARTPPKRPLKELLHWEKF
ncbi:MAG: nitroreductase family protein [Candidatus Omnitrophica bacterium]|nr:nitroreductase family protein [Candidatus Omnitrophota bacterium]